jgi:pilus assembly protein Flp/PilA
MKSVIARFARDETGATSVEYAVIAGVIALGIVASVGAIRDGLNAIFENTSNGLK